MNDEPGAVPDVPAEVVALAELDAGLPTSAEAARRRVDAAADPAAAAVLEALAATRAELAGLPPPVLPAAVAARWTAALAAERAQASHPGRNLTATTGRRRWSRRVLAAAAAGAVAAVLGGLLHRPAPPPPPAPAVSSVGLVAFARAAVGTSDVDTLVDPARRAACLSAVAPAAAHDVLVGGRRVVLDGRPGVLLVLATGAPGQLRIVTVDPACGPAGGTLLAQLVVG